MRLADVSPRSAGGDAADRAARYTKGATDGWQRHSGSPHGSNLRDVGRGELSVVMPLADSARWLGSAPLGFLVRHVVGVRSEEQMVRAHARRVVAAVENVQAARNGTVLQFPSQSVREHLTMRPTKGEQTVALAVVVPNPGPASVRDTGPLSEAVLNGWQSPMTHETKARATFDQPSGSVVAGGKRRRLTASTGAIRHASLYPIIRDSAGNSAASNVATIAAAQPTVTSTSGPPARTTVTPADVPS